MDYALGESRIGNLPEVTFSGMKDSDPFGYQRGGRKRRMTATFEADEFRYVLEVLTEHILRAARKNRYRLRAEANELFPSGRIVQYVERQELDAFLRKKLFRSQAAASTRLGK
jgi:hypothetical protein